MASFDYLPLVLTGVGIIVSILYYTSVLRNANKAQQLQQETRQATAYIQTLGFRDANFMKAYYDVMYFQKYSDYDEWKSKYHPAGVNWKEEYLESFTNFSVICNSFQSTGLLVSQGIIDSEIVFEQEGEFIMRLWERMKSNIVGIRVDGEYDHLFTYYESLYDEMKRLQKERNSKLAT